MLHIHIPLYYVVIVTRGITTVMLYYSDSQIQF